MKLEDEIKQPKFNSEFQKLAVNIIFTYNWLNNNQLAFFKKYDLTPQQFNVLRILRGQHPETASVSLIKERMLDKMSDASRLVDRLVAKELVERHICPKDRRKADVNITEKGLKLLEEIDVKLNAVFENLENISIDEAKQLNALLDKLRG